METIDEVVMIGICIMVLGFAIWAVNNTGFAIEQRESRRMITIESQCEQKNEALIGWRAWRAVANADATMLQSWLRTTIWPAGIMLKEDPRSMGIHAFKTKGHLLHYISGAACDHDVIIGQVALAGDIYEHKRGWRAEYAYPISLQANDATTAETLRRTYGCETHVGETNLARVEFR